MVFDLQGSMNLTGCKCHSNIFIKPKLVNKDQSRLEDLPNELLTDIFKQLDARELFRAFHNLNNRFNQLIQTFNYLQLTFHMNTSNVFKGNDEIFFFFYVHTLIADPWMPLKLKYFSNVRRLKLIEPLPNVIEQLKANVMPHLEHLSILYAYTMYEISLLHNEIFSNRFPKLISCELIERQTLLTIQQWISSPSIRILKTEYIDFDIFEVILAACPNLSFLKFSIHVLKESSTNTLLHQNLKCMIIDLKSYTWFDDDHHLSDFLARTPNLQRLEIHRRHVSRDTLLHLEHYDWLASMINFRLPLLQRFKFHFYSSDDKKSNEFVDINLLTQFQSDFIKVHQGQYQARFEVHRGSV